MVWLLSRGVFVALALAMLGLNAPAQAQSYPSKNINIGVSIGAGTGMDVLVRLYADRLSQNGIRERNVQAERSNAATQRLRSTCIERMARAWQCCSALDVGFQQSADRRVERKPRSMDARDSVEAGRRIM